jgi:hypothetical protein
MAETKVTDQTRSAIDAQTITASTTTTFSDLTRCIYVGTAGDLGVKFSSSGSTVTFTNVANGYHPLQVEVVTQATTADGVIALF